MFNRSLHFRFMSKQNDTMVVRALQSPQGCRIFELDWNEGAKSLEVRFHMTGELVGRLPGRWGPRATFQKARRSK